MPATQLNQQREQAVLGEGKDPSVRISILCHCPLITEGTWEPVTLSTMPTGQPVQKPEDSGSWRQAWGKRRNWSVPDRTENLETGL